MPPRLPARRLLVLTTAMAFAVAACSSSNGTATSNASPNANAGTDVHGAAGTAGAVKSGGTFTFALAEDPDKLDPTFARTLVGREVFANFCEKLYDVDQKLTLVPQLAAALPVVSADKKSVTIKLRENVTFNDGTPFDAQAVKTTLDRYRTVTGSARAADLSSVSGVTVVDPHTVRLSLTKPFSPLAGALADRAGMILSPTQLQKMGDNFASQAVCVASFSYVIRKPGNEIVLEKSTHYYDKD